AEELLVALLEKRRNFLGDDHPDTRWTIEELANLYQAWCTEAEDQYHIVVEKSISIPGEYHPNTLRAMGGLGMTYCASGQFKKAEDLLTIVFNKQKKVLREEHPGIVFTMGLLASTYGGNSKYDHDSCPR
ncbi:hypothetical protein B0H14DRAFT_2369685, partial [Mycena olivaceomarginata]